MRPNKHAFWCSRCNKWGYTEANQADDQRRQLDRINKDELAVVYRGDCGNWHCGRPYKKRKEKP